MRCDEVRRAKRICVRCDVPWVPTMPLINPILQKLHWNLARYKITTRKRDLPFSIAATSPKSNIVKHIGALSYKMTSETTEMTARVLRRCDVTVRGVMLGEMRRCGSDVVVRVMALSEVWGDVTVRGSMLGGVRCDVTV